MALRTNQRETTEILSPIVTAALATEFRTANRHPPIAFPETVKSKLAPSITVATGVPLQTLWPTRKRRRKTPFRNLSSMVLTRRSS